MSQPAEATSSQPEQAPEPGVRRVEQDGREVLLLELGAARERVDWLVAHNDRLRQDAEGAMAQAQEYARLLGQAKSAAVNWRLLGIVAMGAYVIQALARLLPAG